VNGDAVMRQELQRAVADPARILARHEYEPLAGWQARAVLATIQPWLAAAPEQVTVCSECLRASCRKWILPCEAVHTASTVDLPVQALKALRREDPTWWDGTYERTMRQGSAVNSGN
jgi:hypothetical protein